MAPYVYKKLDSKIRDIRILTLLPGTFEELLRIVISHEDFDVPTYDPEPRSVIKPEDLEGLPLGWQVCETIEGRIVYDYDDPETGNEHSSWTHPNPDSAVCNHSPKYDILNNFSSDYEAL